jgi:hypothetical protein
VKLCIELDKEMLEKWNWTKEDFKQTLEDVHGKRLVPTDKIVFDCLLFCYEEGDIDALPISFAANLSKEETEAIEKDSLDSKNIY